MVSVMNRAMIRLAPCIVGIFGLLAPLLPQAQVPQAAPQAVVKTPRVEAQLIARHAAFEPGKPIEVALRLKIIDHWHTYWRNPGDSGLPTRLKWTLPDNFSAGEIQWPYPKKLPLGSLMNFGYEGEVLHLVTIQTPANFRAGESVTFTAKADWLVCADVCIPEEGLLTLTLPAVVSPPMADARWAAAFLSANTALPKSMLNDVTARIDGLQMRIESKTTLPANVDVLFYPYRDDVIANAVKPVMTKTPGGFSLDVTLAEPRNEELKLLDGVLVIEGARGAWAAPIVGRAVTIAAPVVYGAAVAINQNKNSNAGTGAPIATKTPGNGFSGVTFISALMLAFLGGLLLNLMPCVFPVLGIKVLGFVETAHGDNRILRMQGAAFFIGVVLSFMLLAALMLLLRAAGQSIGWGFQLQEPIFVASLAVLFFVMALNLSGVFEMGLALQAVAGGAELRAQKSPVAGAFSSGVLATVVATPCMAPGLGASVGFTLGQSAPIALAVFFTIAIGLALPVVLLAFFPVLLRYLPKPGAWMQTFKQFMAFPLYATVVWLVWVLGAQTSNDGVAMFLAGLTLIAMSAWIFGHWQGYRLRLASVLGALIAAVGIGAIWFGANAETVVVSQTAVRDDDWVPFSKEKIAELRSQGKSVFVDFTATWCITCQLNKRVALNQPDVVKKMAEANVVRMKADWTKRDAAITAALAEFGRNGVPLYVFYPARGEPHILPELLTQELVLAAIANSVRQ